MRHSDHHTGLCIVFMRHPDHQTGYVYFSGDTLITKQNYVSFSLDPDHQTGLCIFFRRCPNHQTGHRRSGLCLDVRRGGTSTLEQSRSPAFPRKRRSGKVKATSTASRCPQFRTSHLASSCLGCPQALQLP